MEIKLRNGPAIVALVFLGAAFVGYRAFLHSSLPGNPEVRRQLETNLQSEIAGSIMGDVAAIEAAIEGGDTEAATEIASGVLERRVEIGDLAMRGSGDDIIVRADYTVHGPEGADQRVGYFAYSHSAITGWRYRRETTSLSWYLKIF